MSRFRPSAVRAHWITGLSVLAAGFLVFLSVAAFSTSDPQYETTDRILAVVTGVGALALVGGLWVLRNERLGSWAAYALIVPPLIVVASFFWFFLVPTIIALAILYAGVVKGGLQRELRLS